MEVQELLVLRRGISPGMKLLNALVALDIEARLFGWIMLAIIW